MKMFQTMLLIAIAVALLYIAHGVRAQSLIIRQAERELGLLQQEVLATEDTECTENKEVAVVLHNVDELPPRVRQAIAEAAAAIESLSADHESQATGDDTDALAAGPDVFVDLDIIAQIESNNRDDAISPAGARGRYQIMEAAWTDTLAWLKRNRGMRLNWEWKTQAHDGDVARVVAGHYINDILPRWLTIAKLYKSDSTDPVPDSLHARVAAYNCGAKRVRQAYARWQAQTGTALPWVAYLPAETQTYLARYAAAAEPAQKTN